VTLLRKRLNPPLFLKHGRYCVRYYCKIILNSQFNTIFFEIVSPRLLQYPIAENRTGPQTVDILIKRIGALGASQSGQFLVDCETYTSAPTMGG
jgi:hypothetical protein